MSTHAGCVTQGPQVQHRLDTGSVLAQRHGSTPRFCPSTSRLDASTRRIIVTGSTPMGASTSSLDVKARLLDARLDSSTPGLRIEFTESSVCADLYGEVKTCAKMTHTIMALIKRVLGAKCIQTIYMQHDTELPHMCAHVGPSGSGASVRTNRGNRPRAAIFTSDLGSCARAERA